MPRPQQRHEKTQPWRGWRWARHTPIHFAVATGGDGPGGEGWSIRLVPSPPRDRPPSRRYRTGRSAEIVTGSDDGQAAGRAQNRPSAEDNFRVVIRRERLVNGVRLHVETASRAVEETAHREQPILGAAGHEVERRPPAEDDSAVWGSQPLYAKLLRRKQNPETLMDPEYRRDACEDINGECESAMLSSFLAPVVVRGSRGIAEDQETLLFRQPP